MITTEEIVQILHKMSKPERVAGMKRFGIKADGALGIPLPEIRAIARLYKKESSRHMLALELWEQPIHEAKLLAGMLAEPQKLTPHIMDQWTNSLYSWDLCDQVCSNLFQKTPYFLEKAFEYSYSKEEFVKRCGFVLMIEYVVHHKKAPDEICLGFLKRIEEEAWDSRNFVKKALNWGLRQIGKRNSTLWEASMKSANTILQQPSKSAQWIARNAIKELEEKKINGQIRE